MTYPRTLRGLPGLKAITLAAVALALSLLPDVAFAERGRVHLEDGSIIQGEIVTYQPGVGVTVELANGSRIELSAEDVARVEIGTEPPPAPPITAPSVAALWPESHRCTGSACGDRARSSPPGNRGADHLGRHRPRTGGHRRPHLCALVRLRRVLRVHAPLHRRRVGDGHRRRLAIAGLAIWLPLRVKERRRLEREDGVALRLDPEVSRHHAGLRLSGTF